MTMVLTTILAQKIKPYMLKPVAEKGAEMYKHPEEAASFVDFLLALLIFVIIAAAIGAIGSAVAKSVFDADKEQTTNTFLGVGGVTLAICVICYFIA